MKEVVNCPTTLKHGFDTFSPKGCCQLFGCQRVSHVLEFELDEFREVGGAIDAMCRISVSGVQEKFPAVVDCGVVRLAGDGERATHILKPAPWDRTLRDRKQIPANEHLTMQIATQVYGIRTAINGLCFTPSGQAVYVTRRFDVVDENNKLVMEDFASVLSRNDEGNTLHFKYMGCYEDIAMAIRRYVPSWTVDIERFFKIVVFNYIYGNGDAHLKNFSLIVSAGGWELAPAYDLLNTELHVSGDDFALDGGLSPNIERSDVYDNSGHPCRLDFERFGERIGLNSRRIKRVLDEFCQLPSEADVLIDNSFLNEKCKRSYRRVVKERLSRFNRVSE